MRLKRILPKRSGRSKGKITVRHQGGRAKRFLREVDFKRDKKDIWARVETVEYDPGRSAEIALLTYEDGERKYILAPAGLKEGQRVISGEAAPLEIGNALPLSKIPIGTFIHNLEIKPGKGGQVAKSAGSLATVFGEEKDWILVKLPSGEIRRFNPGCFATVGQVGRIEKKTEKLGKAGRKRRMGIRPGVRGVAQHPAAHPHGGGEGRSGVGLKYPKTVYGKPAVGKTRPKRKYSDRLVIQKRKMGAHV